LTKLRLNVVANLIVIGACFSRNASHALPPVHGKWRVARTQKIRLLANVYGGVQSVVAVTEAK
jgi:hypothetical protein